MYTLRIDLIAFIRRVCLSFYYFIFAFEICVYFLLVLALAPSRFMSFPAPKPASVHTVP